MGRFFKKRSVKAGLPPGALVPLEGEKAEPVRITVIDYDATHFLEREVESVEECLSFRDQPTITWINIDGIHHVEVVERIGQLFEIHPLVLEDIVTSGQRPKVEDFEKYLYTVVKMLSYKGRYEAESEQVSFVLGRNFVISFQETVGDVFDPVRERLRQDRGRIRKMGADYLLYSLIDAIIDNYFTVLEKMGEKVAAVEEVLLKDPTREVLLEVHELQRETLFMRKAVWPVRELVGKLLRGESRLVQPTTTVYLRDLYDHAVLVIDTLETLREVMSHMLEIYVSHVSNKLNEVMKVLTVIATIFIPITWIASVYGMNFEASFWPRSDSAWSFPATMALMVILSLLMVLYFKRRKWF